MLDFKKARSMFFRFQKGSWLFFSASWGLVALIIGGSGLLNAKDITNTTESFTMTPEMMKAAQYVTIYGLLGTGVIILSLVIWLTFFTNKDKNLGSGQTRKIDVTNVPDTLVKEKGEQ